ncbi:DUF1801 domain-containing protein [Antrihabitans sp. YC2-6]|uniref:DUF1801 domain-containing protein n=1 Tax=Antrihabitans sp. YC2-6 TaxID=2799498 RepID=UPI0018F69C63|nr:DUF1801 domain-containing protein [Antrihabitans sp. YC2-6]MBJ8348643.1 DUF1801 domain-containing protein [Antrihabitans sp. YC2-6]
MATQPTDVDVQTFLDAITDPRQRADSDRLVQLMTEATGELPKMWGASIVGFGNYHYRYASGTEGDAPLVGFSPRKRELTLYLTTEPEVREELLSRVGPHRAGAGCVYFKRLDTVDPAVLREFVERTVAFTRAQDVTG